MSNTRKAESGKPFRQERFSSSAEFERGLLANLVARRCEVLDSAAERELVWFIQYLSHQEGGLKAVAATLLEKASARLGTVSMRKLGCRTGQVYDADKVRAVRTEIQSRSEEAFMLRGEHELLDVLTACDSDSVPDRREIREDELDARQLRAIRAREELATKSQAYPNKYPAQAFYEVCRKELSSAALEALLMELCLNPAVPVSGAWPWWFVEFTDCLREFMAAWIAERSAATVTTEIGRQVHDSLDYALSTKCLVLIDGQARIGKTFSAKAWCAQHPGRARYVQVPSSNDDIGFFRAIAKALGVSASLHSKAQELRERIDEVLQTAQLSIIFDEAHYLWPAYVDARALPSRVNWILTALVNYGVPVALITTPQFLKTQRMIEAKTRWASEQFTGRIGHYQPLPENLSEADLEKVSRALLPEGDAVSIKILVKYAQASSKYIAGIESSVRRARYLAAKDNRPEVCRADIKRAIEESVIPSDSAMAKAMELPQRATGRRSSKLSLKEPLPSFKDRSSERTQPILADEQSDDTAGRNRLELHREGGALVPG